MAAVMVSLEFISSDERAIEYVRGMLKDPASAPDVAASLERWFVEEMGWKSLGLIASPIAGGDGNQEYLLAGTKP